MTFDLETFLKIRINCLQLGTTGKILMPFYFVLFGSVIGYEDESISLIQGVAACEFVLASERLIPVYNQANMTCITAAFDSQTCRYV